MSLILDALKKAEQDRHAGQAPVLDDMLVRRGPSPATRRREQQRELVLMAGVAAALAFAIAGLVYWLWPSSNSVEQASAPPTSVAANAVAAPPQAPAVLPSAPAPALLIDPERLEAPLDDMAETPVESMDPSAPQAMTLDELDGETPQISPSKPPLSAPPAQPPAAASPAPEIAQPAPAPAAPQPAAAPSAPVVSVSANDAAPRPLKDMPPAFRSELPKLTVDVHVYDANPLRRFVLINGKKYRESDTLLDGPRLVEITAAGVVIEHRGSRVLLELPR